MHQQPCEKMFKYEVKSLVRFGTRRPTGGYASTDSETRTRELVASPSAAITPQTDKESPWGTMMHRKPTSRAGRRSARRSHLHPTHGPNRTHRLALGLGLAKQTLARAVRHVARRVTRAPNCRDANKRSPSVALPPPHLNRDVDGGRQLGSRAVPSKLGSRAKTTSQSRLGPSRHA